MSRGHPDWLLGIDYIRRGEIYPEYAPRSPLETYKIFYVIYVDGAELAVGASAHYIDVETNVAMPYTHAAGIISDFREWYWNFDGRVSILIELDGIPFIQFPDPFASVHEYEQVVWFKSSLIDPLAEDTHTWDITITNLDSHAIKGVGHIALVLTTVE